MQLIFHFAIITRSLCLIVVNERTSTEDCIGEQDHVRTFPNRAEPRAHFSSFALNDAKKFTRCYQEGFGFLPGLEMRFSCIVPFLISLRYKYTIK